MRRYRSPSNGNLFLSANVSLAAWVELIVGVFWVRNPAKIFMPESDDFWRKGIPAGALQRSPSDDFRHRALSFRFKNDTKIFENDTRTGGNMTSKRQDIILNYLNRQDPFSRENLEQHILLPAGQ